MQSGHAANVFIVVFSAFSSDVMNVLKTVLLKVVTPGHNTEVCVTKIFCYCS